MIRRTALVLLVACLWAPLATVAGSLSVSPIRFEFAPAQRSVTLTVRNDGDQPTLVHTSLLSWSQADDDDRLEATTDLLASPPIFSIAPGASQLVRIALRRAPDNDLERSYRIILSEVPGQPQANFNGARFALKISLPVFVEAAAGKASPQIQWTAVRSGKGDLALTAFNSGAKHLQVRSIEVASAGAAAADARFAGLWYILPGQRRKITIAADPGRAIATDRVRINADTDAGALVADVVLDPR